MSPLQKIPAWLRLRLMVALPALLSLFMLTAGLFIYFRLPGLVVPRELTVEAVMVTTATWILLMTGLAFVGNLGVALFLSRHLKNFIYKIDSSMRPNQASPSKIEATYEIETLGIVLDQASTTLSKFVTDSYIIDHLPEAVLTVDRSRQIVRMNHTAAKLLGADPGAAIGKDLGHFIAENPTSMAFYHLLDQGLTGVNVPLRVVSFPLNGGATRDYWVTIAPVLGGSQPGASAVSISIKDQASIAAIKNQIQKIERLAAVGRVASGIAHEVRNPLGAIRTFTELIQEDLPETDSRAGYTREILNQIERLDHLVEDVLGFSRDVATAIEAVDLPELLARAVRLAQYKFPDSAVGVSENHQPGLPEVQGDPEKLFQAFFNLLINAFEACGHQGKISVRAETARAAGESGRTVCVSVADDGPGIPPECQSRVFEPFFTTKPAGTGLGLATTYNIVAAHGGKVEILSEPDKGSTFLVFLPEKHHFCEMHS
jgi:signal transduction histidine kinase